MVIPSRHLEIAMQRALPQLLALVAELMAMIGIAGGILPTTIARAVHIKALRLLRPAEALARRLIVLMAREIEVNEPAARGSAPRTMAAQGRSRHQGTPRHGERRRTMTGPPTPGFRLFEPIPSFGLTFVSEADTAQPEPAASATQRTLSPTSLIARITALKTVLDDPEARAERHALFLAKRPHPEPVEGRSEPMQRPHRPGLATRPCS